jgi:hypothetical protein
MPEIAFQYQVPKKMIGTFVVDAFLAEHYQFSNSVTDIPVEEGSNIADHIIEDQDVISVEAFIGNTAFDVITIDGNAVSNLEGPRRQDGAGTAGLSGIEKTDKSEAAAGRGSRFGDLYQHGDNLLRH